MLKVQDRLQWEVEYRSGEVVRQYLMSGEEVPSTIIQPDKVARASIIPRVQGLPRHDILLDPSKGEKFLRRFGRGIIKNTGNGVRVVEYLQVLVTNRYRLYVCSTSGQGMVTNPDFEVYL